MRRQESAVARALSLWLCLGRLCFVSGDAIAYCSAAGYVTSLAEGCSEATTGHKHREADDEAGSNLGTKRLEVSLSMGKKSQ